MIIPLSRKITYALLFIPVILFVIFQFHQISTFNPYWGYDGGAHVEILETLLFEHHFPSIEENYLAWHEPLYYLVLVFAGFLGIPFMISHFFVLILLDALVFALWRRFGFSVRGSVFGALATLSLPPFLEVGMFYTNEAMNYVFLTVFMHMALIVWKEKRWSLNTSVFLGVFVALGTLTKITALVAFGVISVLLLIKIIREKEWKYIGTIFFVVFLSVMAYLPWYAVRSAGLERVSVNNYEMLPAKSFALDERVAFMTSFDRDIFQFPFWYSGARGFWSMLYADTVSDYLGIFENQDRKNALPKEALILTTHNGNSVSAYRKPLAQLALLLGMIPVSTMMIGVGSALSSWFRSLRHKERFDGFALPVLGFFSAFMLALLYYAYRYPYYDQGVVKSIFIAPAFLLPLMCGVRVLWRAPQLARLIIYGAWTFYIVVVLSLFFVRSG